mgnify:CR=1 FL=1
MDSDLLGIRSDEVDVKEGMQHRQLGDGGVLRQDEGRDVLRQGLARRHVEEFADEIDRYIRWYNEKRVKRSLGGKSPLQYKRSLGFVA